MIPTQVSVSSATYSPWIPVDPTQNWFGIGFNVDLNSLASGITYSIQHTFDSLANTLNCSVARSGTTVTMVCPMGHNLNTEDSIIVKNANQTTGNTGLDGTYTITVSSNTTFTYTSGTSGTIVATPATIEVIPIRVQNHSTVVGAITSIDGNYAFPIRAIRIILTAWTAGTATLTVLQGRK